MIPPTPLMMVLLLFQGAVAGFDAVEGPTLAARFANAVERGGNAGAPSFWVAYGFPLEAGIRFTPRPGDVHLRRFGGGASDIGDGIVRASGAEDPTSRAGIFLRFGGDGSLERVRLLDLEERYSFSGRAVYWLGSAPEGESLALIERLIGTSSRKEASKLLMIAGLHEGEGATGLLVGIARGSYPGSIRERAVFWLGQEVGQRAARILGEIVMEDTAEVELQKHAVFAISRRDGDGPLATLMDVAENHPSLEVRRAAIFWLGRRGGPAVVDFFERLLRR